MDTLIDSVHIISLLVYILACSASALFWLKLRHEKYWIGFPVTFFFLMLHELFEILTDAYNINVELFAEISEIIGAFILIFTMYYLIKELQKISLLESLESSEDD